MGSSRREFSQSATLAAKILGTSLCIVFLFIVLVVLSFKVAVLLLAGAFALGLLCLAGMLLLLFAALFYVVHKSDLL